LESSMTPRVVTLSAGVRVVDATEKL